LARYEGDEVGVIKVESCRGSPLFIPEGSACIGSTAVQSDILRAGVGTANVEAALEWAREHEYRAATLHFATANPRSVPFWTGLGFQPVMWHLRRRLEERIA
jgi:GNAT superfamily N-acetyltransferase